MTRRTLASVIAAVLLVVLLVVAFTRPVGYVIFQPGPTINVLGLNDNKKIIDVTGHKVYPDKGGLRLVTIIPSGPDERVSLVSAIEAWINPDQAVYPHDAVYAPTDNTKTVEAQSSQEMVSSQDNAVAAALHALHITFGKVVEVAAVDKGGPADGKLKVNDRILKVNGVATPTTASLIKAVQGLPPGSHVDLQIRRNEKVQDVELTTVPSVTNKNQSAVRIQIGVGYDFPFNVALRLDKNIGGPSAGLMFSLGVYDVLTPGSLTEGKVIAGTGEIDAAGNVGEIGGIQQKLVGAQHDGARLFLVPAGNCAEALGGNYDPNKMRLVKVNKMADALSDVKAWVKNPDAALPKCTR
ncbi:MAG: hypothetical protein JWR35_1020 [Marmoricola sp.]|jgi:PDZ domain-containing protein|nr:hypothetical protein [Marmoricola sp.]